MLLLLSQYKSLLQVDDSQNVSELIKTVCAKIGENYICSVDVLVELCVYSHLRMYVRTYNE